MKKNSLQKLEQNRFVNDRNTKTETPTRIGPGQKISQQSVQLLRKVQHTAQEFDVSTTTIHRILTKDSKNNMRFNGIVLYVI